MYPYMKFWSLYSAQTLDYMPVLYKIYSKQNIPTWQKNLRKNQETE